MLLRIYFEDIHHYRPGVSERRRAWIHSKCQSYAAAPSVHVKELRETLGRLGWVAGPIKHLRAARGPVYSWCAPAPAQPGIGLPALLRHILTVIGEIAREPLLMDCRSLPVYLGDWIRTDAGASDDTVTMTGGSSPTAAMRAKPPGTHSASPRTRRALEGSSLNPLPVVR